MFYSGGLCLPDPANAGELRSPDPAKVGPSDVKWHDPLDVQRVGPVEAGGKLLEGLEDGAPQHSGV